MKGFKDRIRQNPYTKWMLIGSNWIFQGILHSSRTECIYKLFSTAFFTAGCVIVTVVKGKQISIKVLATSLVIGHTINWILNGNLSALLIHRLFLLKLDKDRLFAYLSSFQKRIQGKKFVLYSAAFGSLTRGELKDTSDLDVSIVRNPGFGNGVCALIFVLIEKKRAEFTGIPLEIYIDENPQSSRKRFGAEDCPVVLYDPGSNICKYYLKQQTIEMAYDLNQKVGGA